MKTATAPNPFSKGDGVNFALRSDVRPATVLKVTAKSVTVREDIATLLTDAIPGKPAGCAAHFEGRQRWAFSADPNGAVITFRPNKYGWRSPSGHLLREGRAAFRDFDR